MSLFITKTEGYREPPDSHPRPPPRGGPWRWAPWHLWLEKAHYW